MDFGTTLRVILETAMSLFVIWAVFHEDLFIAFEDRIAAHFRRRRGFKVIKGNGNSVGKSYYPVSDRRA